MPYISEKIPLPPQYDRRRKLTEDDKFEIVRLRKEHNLSQRTLARMFGVSRRLIIFIIDTERHERAKAQFKERRKDGRYYDRETHRKAIKNLREYKHKLYLDGKIKEEKC